MKAKWVGKYAYSLEVCLNGGNTSNRVAVGSSRAELRKQRAEPMSRLLASEPSQGGSIARRSEPSRFEPIKIETGEK